MSWLMASATTCPIQSSSPPSSVHRRLPWPALSRGSLRRTRFSLPRPHTSAIAPDVRGVAGWVSDIAAWLLLLCALGVFRSCAGPSHARLARAHVDIVKNSRFTAALSPLPPRWQRCISDNSLTYCAPGCLMQEVEPSSVAATFQAPPAIRGKPGLTCQLPEQARIGCGGCGVITSVVWLGGRWGRRTSTSLRGGRGWPKFFWQAPRLSIRLASALACAGTHGICLFLAWCLTPRFVASPGLLVPCLIGLLQIDRLP